MQTYFLPMTRMNFVGAVDAGLLAPAAFYMERKFYEENDVSVQYPNCHLLTKKRSHLISVWNDDPEVLNFPLIVEVTIPLNGDVQTLLCLDGKLDSQVIDASLLSTESMFLYAGVIPISSIVAVTVPGPKTLQSLINDPYLRGDIKFKTNVLDTLDVSPALDLIALGSNLPSPLHNLPLSKLDFYLRVVAGIVLASECMCSQQWARSWNNAEAVFAIDYFLNGLNNSVSDLGDLHSLMAFQPINPIDDSNSLSSLVKVSLQCLRDFSSDSSFMSSLGPEHQANHLVLNEMFHKFSETDPSKSSPSEVIASLIESIKVVVPERSDDEVGVLQRLIHGLQLVLESVKGVSTSDVFKSKVDWATSVRAAMLFCLRSEPDQLLNWEVEGRPRGAKVGDLSKAAFFSGLYHGYTVLPVSIKRKWQPFLDECFRRVFGYGAQNVTVTSTWAKIGELLDGQIVIRFGDAGEVSLTSGVHTSELLRDYIDFVSSDIKTGSIGALDRYILSIIANQKALFQYKLLNIFVTDPSGLVMGTEGMLTLRQNVSQVNHGWDYTGIIEYLADSSQMVLSEEVLALICKRLNYKFASLLEQRSHTLNSSIEAWLRGFEKSVPSISSVDGNTANSTGNIHTVGRQLVKCFADFISTESHDVSKDIQLLHGLLYVAFPVDLISEGIDPDLGLVDDWLILSDITNEFCDALAKKKNKNIAGFVKVARVLSSQLVYEIRKEFGDGFIAAVLKSSPTHLNVTPAKTKKARGQTKSVSA